MPQRAVAYLGPEGTFSHLVARKRFGARANLVPVAGIYEVFEFVKGGRGRLGVVPIENSTGGTIVETIDCLVENRDRVFMREELSLNVKLALLGHRGQKIRRLYSHFVPLQHCSGWIRKHLPGVERHEAPSTARAAEIAGGDPAAAALGTRAVAGRHNLRVLKFPVHSDVPNITEFAVIGTTSDVPRGAAKTSLMVTLENRPGSLFDFLQAFKHSGVNLTRLISRPIVGQPKSYLFVVDLQGAPRRPVVRRALADARRAAHTLSIIGVYPVRRMYAS